MDPFDEKVGNQASGEGSKTLPPHECLYQEQT